MPKSSVSQALNEVDDTIAEEDVSTATENIFDVSKYKSQTKGKGTRKKKTYFSCFFRAGRPCSKNAPKMISRSPSGTLPGTPRRPQEAARRPPRRAQRGSRGARQESPK